MTTSSPILVALDFATAAQALDCARTLSPNDCRIKIGKELFTQSGPQLVESIQDLGFEVFLDLKFHDIPNTVAAAVDAAARLGVWMVNVHASGGRKMMVAAREALEKHQKRPLLIAVTILTSLSDEELFEIGYMAGAGTMVEHLAALTQSCGLDGVVSSAREAEVLRNNLGHDFKLITPGIRLPESAKDDQTRILTPEAAIAAGANYLVVGRPITRSADPAAALAHILERLSPLKGT
jgi:orotidine-5'-phosphate decarboxylase